MMHALAVNPKFTDFMSVIPYLSIAISTAVFNFEPQYGRHTQNDQRSLRPFHYFCDTLVIMFTLSRE